MSQTLKSTLALFLILTIALAMADHTLAGHVIPKTSNTADDKKQPEFLIEHDGSYFVPGIGRFMYPKKGHGYNPFTYNPVTGTNSGINIGIGGDNSGGASHSQIPGGDDTLLPNPQAGSPPSPASP